MKKRITILGSTGSIGSQAVGLIEENLDEFDVYAITANSNVKMLFHQAKILQPKVVVVGNSDLASSIRQELGFLGIKVASGKDALIDVACSAELVMSAMVGIAGLPSTIAAIKNGLKVAVANKESLVCGGEIITRQEMNKIIPVDSEHNSIYRMVNVDTRKIILTASGGPFHNNDKEFSLKEALNHPVWTMGRKISIDSATMMNKVLEVIEAHYLFDLNKDNIKILIHPEAVIHGMVVNEDGSCQALMFNPDMKVCISHALSCLIGKRSKFVNNLDFSYTNKLTFFEPDYEKFPVLKFIKSDQYITINAANELAVGAFLADKISFKSIYRIIAECLDKFHYSSVCSVEHILDIDTNVRSIANALINKAMVNI